MADITVPDWVRVGATVAFIARPVHLPTRISPATVTSIGKRYVSVTSSRIKQRFDMTHPETRDDGTVWYQVRQGYSGSVFLGPADSAWAREVGHAQLLRDRARGVERAHSQFDGVPSIAGAQALIKAVEEWIEVHRSGAF